MSLPINMKFEVPKLKAPAPTRTPLWPSLSPAPAARSNPAAEKADASAGGRPITNQTAVSPKAREARPAVVFTSPRRGRSHGRRRSLLVKLALPGIPLFAILAVINSGCATQKPKAQGSVLDVGPQPAALPETPPPPAAYSSAPYTGPTYSAPTYARPSSPARQAPPPATAEPVVVAPPARPAPAAVGRTYIVQRGDTMFGIARTQYGDGNKWKKIAAANPAVNADALKEGQKLVIPQ